MRRRRSTLLSGARGRVVEIGAGTGLNIAHYPDGIDELVLMEPEPAMRRRLARRLQRHARAARIIEAPAEHLPLTDESVDTVVSTLVLCTVDDPERALREIARVLRPGGQLLFVEHVRASSRFLAAWQDYLFQPWRSFAGGCRCNRPTVELMRACGSQSRPTTACGAACRRSSIRSSSGGRLDDLHGRSSRTNQDAISKSRDRRPTELTIPSAFGRYAISY